MQYTSRKEFLADCVISAVGTYLDENYRAYNFEDMIGTETPEQRTCIDFILYVKELNDIKYVSKTGFNEFLLKASTKSTISDIQKNTADLIFELSESNKANNLEDLKDPKILFASLDTAKRKTNLFNSVNGLYENENFTKDAVTWDDSYFESLQKSLDDANSFAASETANSDIYFGEDLQKYYSEKIESRKNGEVYSFHNEVFDSLITEGPTPGHGGIIGGSTGMGKSTLALNLINSLINADTPAIYFPIEMGLENTIDRLVALRTGYPFKEIKRIGKTKEATTDLEKAILHEIRGLATHPNFAIVDKANVDMKTLKSYIKRFQAKLPGSKHCVVVIDLLLQIKEFYDDGSNMATQIERAVTKLDIMAKELGVHWIGIVQLNRSVESDKVLSEQSIAKLRPTRSSIKNSSALLERARWAITIFRKKYFADLYLSENEAEGIEDIAEIQLMKANDEAISRRYMVFDGETFKMTYNPDYGKSANGF